MRRDGKEMEISGAERGRGRRIAVATCLITSANTDTSAIIYTERGGGKRGCWGLAVFYVNEAGPITS